MTTFLNFPQKCQLVLKVFAALLAGMLFSFDESVYANTGRVLSNSELSENEGTGGETTPEVGVDEETEEAAGAIDDESPPATCWGLELSEIYTYYASGQAKPDQFIEILNASEEAVDLGKCVIEYYIAYAGTPEGEPGELKESIALSGVLAPDELWAWHSDDERSLTKDPSGAVTLRVVNDIGEVVDQYSYSEQKEGRAWAWFGIDAETGEENWRLTYATTPGAENKVQDCSDPEKVLNPETGRCVNPPEEEEVEEDTSHLPSQCQGLVFSEIFTYYEDSADEQFIEVHNTNSESIQLDGCAIEYKGKEIALSGVLGADDYLARYTPEISLTKNPSKSNELKLVDVNGEERDSLTYYHGQKKGVAYAQFDFLWSGEENWQQTYSLTPGEPNAYQQYKTCPEGKAINEATGNCVKVTSEAVLEACPPGKYRNPLTNRCKSIFTASTELEPCQEGYERNPETNRCRKIVSNSGADYAFAMDTKEGDTNFIAFGVLGAIGVMGVAYVTWQFRREIVAGGRKLAVKMGQKKPGAPT